MKKQKGGSQQKREGNRDLRLGEAGSLDLSTPSTSSMFSSLLDGFLTFPRNNEKKKSSCRFAGNNGKQLPMATQQITFYKEGNVYFAFHAK